MIATMADGGGKIFMSDMNKNYFSRWMKLVRNYSVIPKQQA